MSEGKFRVVIIRTATGEIVRDMGPMSLAKAERVQSGAEVNLDHDNFHTEAIGIGVPKVVPE